MRKMQPGFEKKIVDFIKANELIAPMERILLAISGGADSTALLYTMWELKARQIFNFELFCAHINHQLRTNESDADECFVVNQAAGLTLPITTKRVDVRGFARCNKLSIETAARQLRIESLLDIAEACNCSCIATGHQKNDNAETILQRISRGTGFRGLCGIRPKRAINDKVRFVRPLLCVTRDEIAEYLKKRNLKWRTDTTNADCTYRRNYIRHRLLPALQQHSGSSIIEQLSVLSQFAQRFDRRTCSSAEKNWPKLANPSTSLRTGLAGDKVELNLRSFLSEAEPIQVELIRRSLTAIGSGERDLSQRHYERILQLAKPNAAGRQINLPGKYIVKHEYEKLIFARYAKEAVRSEKISNSVELEIPGRMQFGQFLIESTIYLAPPFIGGVSFSLPSQFIERFDLDKLKPPIVVRPRRNGDRFWPLGLKAEKKVGKFLTAAKLPMENRAKVLIVADAEKIIWVWPIRMSEQAKITGETRKILQLHITDTLKVGGF